MKLNALRKHYRGSLLRSDLNPEPSQQFELWLNEAMASDMHEPNAMCLATVDTFGVPSMRNVLLKHYDSEGFIFFTNLKSRKAQQIEQNPNVSIIFSWLSQERQIIITGVAEQLTRSEVLRYFLLRPRNNQIGAWASQQSEEVSSRSVLEQNFKNLSLAFTGNTIPAPKFWGGYRIRPLRAEFWQGGANRLHDRFVYLLNEQHKWEIKRLAP